MPDNRELAEYQSALLGVLAREDVGAEERAKLLREGGAFAPYATYVAAMEPRFVALGAELMRRWGDRA